jgi:hypothetical protein
LFKEKVNYKLPGGGGKVFYIRMEEKKVW